MDHGETSGSDTDDERRARSCARSPVLVSVVPEPLASSASRKVREWSLALDDRGLLLARSSYALGAQRKVVLFVVLLFVTLLLTKMMIIFPPPPLRPPRPSPRPPPPPLLMLEPPLFQPPPPQR